MKTSSPIQSRLNPFVFPSETGSLFALFMVAAILFAIYVGRVLLVVFARESTQPLRTLDPMRVVRGEALFETLSAMLPYLSVSLLMTLIIFGIATFIYAGHPNRVRRRKRLQPLPDRDMPTQQAVNELAERAGVLPIPIVEMPSGNLGAGGQAFGFRGNYRIGLDGGLRIWQRLKPKQGWFRAVVLHELAHIAHGDIRRSYFAEALWVAMIVAGLAPLLVGLLGSFVQNLTAGLQNDDSITYGVLFQSLLALLRLFLQAGITLVVIAAIRASLLRTREMYADWRAALWGAEDALKELFLESREAGKISLTPAIWKLHPTPSERLALLNQPNQLFRLPWQLPFIVGFLSISILVGIFALAPPFLILMLEPFRASRIWLGEIYQATPNLVNGVLFWGVRSLWFVLFVAGIVGFFAPIVWLFSGVLGVQSQKQALLDLVEGRQGIIVYFKLAIPAVVCSFGMEIGIGVLPFGPFPAFAIGDIATSLVFPSVITILIWLFLICVRFVSLQALTTSIGAARPYRRMRFFQWTLNGWLVLCFVPALLLGLVLRLLAPDPAESFLLPIFIGWVAGTILFTLLAIGLSWVITKGLTHLRPARCALCGQISRSAHPAIEVCAHCGHNLGEWLLMPDKESNLFQETVWEKS